MNNADSDKSVSLALPQKLPHCPSSKSKGKKNPENGARYQQHKHQQLGSVIQKSSGNTV